MMCLGQTIGGGSASSQHLHPHAFAFRPVELSGHPPLQGNNASSTAGTAALAAAVAPAPSGAMLLSPPQYAFASPITPPTAHSSPPQHHHPTQFHPMGPGATTTLTLTGSPSQGTSSASSSPAMAALSQPVATQPSSPSLTPLTAAARPPSAQLQGGGRNTPMSRAAAVALAAIDPHYHPSGGISFNNAPSGVPNLYIMGLPNDFTTDRLHDVFAQFGEIESTRVMVSREVPLMPNRSFGFVLFKSMQSAMEAVARGNGMNVAGSSIQVYFARPKQQHGGGHTNNSPLVPNQSSNDLTHRVPSNVGGGLSSPSPPYSALPAKAQLHPPPPPFGATAAGTLPPISLPSVTNYGTPLMSGTTPISSVFTDQRRTPVTASSSPGSPPVYHQQHPGTPSAFGGMLLAPHQNVSLSPGMGPVFTTAPSPMQPQPMFVVMPQGGAGMLPPQQQSSSHTNAPLASGGGFAQQQQQHLLTPAGLYPSYPQQLQPQQLQQQQVVAPAPFHGVFPQQHQQQQHQQGVFPLHHQATPQQQLPQPPPGFVLVRLADGTPVFAPASAFGSQNGGQQQMMNLASQHQQQQQPVSFQ